MTRTLWSQLALILRVAGEILKKVVISVNHRYPPSHHSHPSRNQNGQVSAFPGLSDSFGQGGGQIPGGADSGFSPASTSLIPSESKGPLSLDKLGDIKGIIDRMGGIDGIIGTVGKVQKMVSSFQQMAPMFKLLMSTFGKKGASTTASDDVDDWDTSARRRRRRGRKTGRGRARRPSGTRRRTGRRTTAGRSSRRRSRR
ncbi:hypothetical protein ACFOQM_07755 [Paenibacillus sp. GCM10012307]|uniref:Tyrosine protein kinase n=1 Tax=Paenibacillus roseus TaxID=2798579 RepID=A0A934J0Q7_9BACL|nr:hypothetical protein [Paenibacillus roseus]MBJ6361184.1 hypothetical protein [Paenibacillus roseus]